MEHWFFFVFIQLLIVFSGFSFFTHHPLFSSPLLVSSSPLSRRTIVSTSEVLFFDEVSEGPGYSSKGIKCVMQREWVCVFVFFQSHAPADLYLMTKNPEDSPSIPDVLEISFRNGLCLRHVSPVDSSSLVGLLFSFFLLFFLSCHYSKTKTIYLI